MSFIDLLLTLLHTFKEAKTRFLLTLAGVSIGVALFIIMSSFLTSAGISLTSMSQEATDADVISVAPKSPPVAQAEKTTRALSRYDAKSVAQNQLFHEATMGYEYQQPSTARAKNVEKAILVSGVTPQALELYKLKIEQGRFFLNQDFKSAKRLCVLGNEVASFFKDKGITLAPGSALRIGDTSFTISGVLEKKGYMGKTSSLFLWDRRVLIPVTTFTHTLRATPQVDLLFVRIPLTPPVDKEIVSLYKEMLHNLLLRLHHGVENFAIKNPLQQSDMISKMINNVIRVLFYGIAGLALLVGGINIMNIMLITVTERRREIGIRRAVGCTRRMLLLQFLVESGLISSVGGIIGIIAGVICSLLLYSALHMFWTNWQLSLPLKPLFVGMAVSFLTGVIFGLYPALKASKLTPDQCLRYE